MFGHTDCVRTLLNAGADLSSAPIKGEHTNKRPYDIATESSKQAFHVHLFEQIAMGKSDSIKKLLHGGVPVHVLDGSDKNESTLHWATSFNNEEVVRLLIMYGFDVNMPNADNQTCLHMACKNSNLELTILLLAEGADINIADKNNNKPLNLLSEKSGNFTVINDLLNSSPAPTLELRNLFLNTISEILSRPPNYNSEMVNSVSNEEKYLQSLDRTNDDNDGDYYLDTCQDDSQIIRDLDPVEEENNEPLLVFWPPTQRQTRRKGPPLVLSSSSVILICIASTDIDIFPLLTWSGLMDTLDRFGLVAQVKRSSPGARIRLCVDPNICPGRHRFEMDVGVEQASITASDSTGLLYAVYTLVQLLELHSDVVTEDGITKLFVPPIAIKDWPDVESRAVMWSYKNRSRTTPSGMKEVVELLSKLRINQIFLQLDPGKFEDESKSNVSEGDTPLPYHDVSAGDSSTTRLYALDEVCRRHCVELIPIVILTSMKHSLPLEMLKNFSHKMICIIFAYEQHPIYEELQQLHPSTRIKCSDLEIACHHSCEKAIASAQLAGLNTFIVGASDWTQRVAAPLNIASKMGVNAVGRSLKQLLAPNLFIKPTVYVPQFVQVLKAHSAAVLDDGLSLSVLPAFTDLDYMYPLLLSKFYCFLHGAFAWNRLSTVDMIGEDTSILSGDYSIIKEVASLIIFSQHSERASSQYREILNVFTGNLQGADSSSNGNKLPSSQDEVPPESDLGLVENILWSLLSSKDHVDLCFAPSKAGAAHCLRYFRRVLNAADWRIGSAPRNIFQNLVGGKEENYFDLQVDEYMSIVHMSSVLCRAIVLSYTAMEKKNLSSDDKLSFGSLIKFLPPGTKSDIANSLLESLEHSTKIWKKRFDKIFAISALASLSNVSDSKSSPPSIDGHDFVLSRRASFIRQEAPAIPIAALFKQISSHLPAANASINDAIKKLLL